MGLQAQLDMSRPALLAHGQGAHVTHSLLGSDPKVVRLATPSAGHCPALQQAWQDP